MEGGIEGSDAGDGRVEELAEGGVDLERIVRGDGGDDGLRGETLEVGDVVIGEERGNALAAAGVFDFDDSHLVIVS